MKDIQFGDEGWTVNGRVLPDPQDYFGLGVSLSRMEAEELGLRVEALPAQTADHTQEQSEPESDHSHALRQENSVGEFPFLLPDDYEEATCQVFDERQREYDQPNGISSLPSEEGMEENGNNN